MDLVSSVAELGREPVGGAFLERNAEIDAKLSLGLCDQGKARPGWNEMSSDLEQNKQNAQAFYDLMFNQCQPREAIKK